MPKCSITVGVNGWLPSKDTSFFQSHFPKLLLGTTETSAEFLHQLPDAEVIPWEVSPDDNWVLRRSELGKQQVLGLPDRVCSKEAHRAQEGDSSQGSELQPAFRSLTEGS